MLQRGKKATLRDKALIYWFIWAVEEITNRICGDAEGYLTSVTAKRRFLFFYWMKATHHITETELNLHGTQNDVVCVFMMLLIRWQVAINAVSCTKVTVKHCCHLLATKIQQSQCNSSHQTMLQFSLLLQQTHLPHTYTHTHIPPWISSSWHK